MILLYKMRIVVLNFICDFKFKALPAPGETAAEAHFFYVSANMIQSSNSRSRPEPTVSKSSTVSFIRSLN